MLKTRPVLLLQAQAQVQALWHLLQGSPSLRGRWAVPAGLHHCPRPHPHHQHLHQQDQQQQPRGHPRGAQVALKPPRQAERALQGLQVEVEG